MYTGAAAATANPYTLRAVQGLTFASMVGGPRDGNVDARRPLLGAGADGGGGAIGANFGDLAIPRAIPTSVGSRRRPDSPPRASFRVLNAQGPSLNLGGAAPVSLSLQSLK